LKKFAYILFSIALYLANPDSAKSQSCIDSLKIDLLFKCSIPDYKPVCGCNGVTYRNDCEATHNGIAQGRWTDGTCSGFEFDITPTFVTNDDHISFSLIQNSTNVTTILIIDMYGKPMYYRTIASSEFFDYSGQKKAIVEINEFLGWQVGTYLMMVYNGKGTYRYKKFVKFGY